MTRIASLLPVVREDAGVLFALLGVLVTALLV